MIEGHKKVYYREISRRIYQIQKDFLLHTNIYPTKPIKTDFAILYDTGMLWLVPGYVSDGASGPTIHTKSCLRGAFVHDAFYRFMRRGLLDIEWRKHADELIMKLCIEDGMFQIRAELWYEALRLFGGRNAKPRETKILVAP